MCLPTFRVNSSYMLSWFCFRKRGISLHNVKNNWGSQALCNGWDFFLILKNLSYVPMSTQVCVLLKRAIHVICIFLISNTWAVGTSCKCVYSLSRVLHGCLPQRVEPSVQAPIFRKGAFSLGQHFPQRYSAESSSHG